MFFRIVIEKQYKFSGGVFDPARGDAVCAGQLYRSGFYKYLFPVR